MSATIVIKIITLTVVMPVNDILAMYFLNKNMPKHTNHLLIYEDYKSKLITQEVEIGVAMGNNKKVLTCPHNLGG